LAGATTQPGEYKTSDNVVYSMDILTWDSDKKKWVPYIADDVVLEFVMLDPYYRIPLGYDSAKSQYRTEFKVPNQHGVFHFKVTYRKPGFTFLEAATKVPVRPFKHNEFERYLFDASPYYVTVFGTLFAFFVFLVYFLYDSPNKKWWKYCSVVLPPYLHDYTLCS